MAIMLMVVLTLSGTGFLQHDYLERRMTLAEIDNQSAFYLAQAGIERARAALKPELTPEANRYDWSKLLTDAPRDSAPDSRLCPEYPSRRCIIPPFGASVGFPDFPIGGMFDAASGSRASYQVRAYDNFVQSGPTGPTTDVDGILVVRALGSVRGQEKVLELELRGSSGLRLINCKGAVGTDCPQAGKDKATIVPLPGREPIANPALPAVDYGYYEKSANYRLFGLDPSRVYSCTAGTLDCSSTTVTVEDNSFYFIDAPAFRDLTDTTTFRFDVPSPKKQVVIVSYANVAIDGNVELDNSIIVGQKDVQLQGNVRLTAQPPYPAIIAGATMQGDAAVRIDGTVFASSVGAIDKPINGVQFHGAIIAKDVYLKSSSTYVTDDGLIDRYDLMPGFVYPESLKMAIPITGTWKEIH